MPNKRDCIGCLCRQRETAVCGKILCLQRSLDLLRQRPVRSGLFLPAQKLRRFRHDIRRVIIICRGDIPVLGCALKAVISLAVQRQPISKVKSHIPAAPSSCGFINPFDVVHPLPHTVKLFL